MPFGYAAGPAFTPGTVLWTNPAYPASPGSYGAAAYTGAWGAWPCSSGWYAYPGVAPYPAYGRYFRRGRRFFGYGRGFAGYGRGRGWW
jgi:hypothetical protein